VVLYTYPIHSQAMIQQSAHLSIRPQHTVRIDNLKNDHQNKPDSVQKHLPWLRNRAVNRQSAQQLRWPILAVDQTTTQPITYTICHAFTIHKLDSLRSIWHCTVAESNYYKVSVSPHGLKLVSSFYWSHTACWLECVTWLCMCGEHTILLQWKL